MGAEHGALPLGYIVIVAFWTVLVAELVGDKTIYTVASLSLRFRAGLVFGASVAAFALKMLAVVLLGRLIVQLHPRWTDALSAVAFFVSALFIWVKEHQPAGGESAAGTGWWRAVAVCFGALFLAEWADPGQIAAAALTVRFHAWLAVWLGGSAAMMTKCGLALVFGFKLRARVPERLLRPLASGSCCALGILALLKAA